MSFTVTIESLLDCQLRLTNEDSKFILLGSFSTLWQQEFHSRHNQ